jgi:ParB/RepB/Spo0J family partition protein
MVRKIDYINTFAGEIFSIDYIDRSKIVSDKNQPRKNFRAIPDLADSIKEVGLIHPIIVRKIDEDKYQVVSGERRFRACCFLRMDKIPCIVRSGDIPFEFITIIENMKRQDLSVIEFSQYISYLLINQVFKTQKDAALFFKTSTTQISKYVAVSNLPDSVISHIDAEDLSPSLDILYEISKFGDVDDQIDLLNSSSNRSAFRKKLKLLRSSGETIRIKTENDFHASDNVVSFDATKKNIFTWVAVPKKGNDTWSFFQDDNPKTNLRVTASVDMFKPGKKYRITIVEI